MKPIYFQVEPEIKDKIIELARAEKRTLKSFFLLLIENKIKLVKNARD